MKGLTPPILGTEQVVQALLAAGGSLTPTSGTRSIAGRAVSGRLSARHRVRVGVVSPHDREALDGWPTTLGGRDDDALECVA